MRSITPVGARTAATWLAMNGPMYLATGVARRLDDLPARALRERGPDRDRVAEDIRARGPLVRGRVTYATADHRVASAVLRSRDFGVLSAPESTPFPGLLRRLRDPLASGVLDPPSLLAIDPPLHARYRKLVSRVFSARAVSGLSPEVDQITRALLDGLPERVGADGTLDLVEEYAAVVPLRVIAMILGIPTDRQADFIAWGNAAAATLDPVLTLRDFRLAQDGLRELNAFLLDHIRGLREHPGTDLLSQLVHARDEGEALTDDELRATALLLLGAGFETTVTLIGNATRRLVAAPDQLALLSAEPERWPNAVEESLRLDPPVRMTARHPLAPTTLEGCELRPRDVVSVLIAGANRDPLVFDRPAEFDVTRANASDHLAFSAGAHFCLGSGLARLEAATALRSLFERFPDLAVAGPGVRRRTTVLDGHEHLPVTLGAPREASVS